MFFPVSQSSLVLNKLFITRLRKNLKENCHNDRNFLNSGPHFDQTYNFTCFEFASKITFIFENFGVPMKRFGRKNSKLCPTTKNLKFKKNEKFVRKVLFFGFRSTWNFPKLIFCERNETELNSNSIDWWSLTIFIGCVIAKRMLNAFVVFVTHFIFTNSTRFSSLSLGSCKFVLHVVQVSLNTTFICIHSRNRLGALRPRRKQEM